MRNITKWVCRSWFGGAKHIPKINGDLIMSNDELVSVIVPAYKAEKFVKQCIDCLINQTYPNLEIIVIYDESPDGTLAILMNYKDRIKLVTQRKTSPSIARNLGISRAQGKYIAFCDIDDYFDARKIESQIEIMNSNPSIGLTYTDTYVIDTNHNTQRKLKAKDWNRNWWLDNQFIVFSSIIARKRVIDDLIAKDGYCFDSSLPAYDDFDFLIRLSTLTSFKRVPKFLTYYIIHEQNLSSNYPKMLILRLKILLNNRLYYYFLKSLLKIPIQLMTVVAKKIY